MDKFEHAGKWWLPSHPENQLSGTLKFDPLDGITLELIGAFSDIFDSDKVRERDIILGETSSGKDVSLYKCLETKASISFGASFSTSYFKAKVAFLGHHFAKIEDIIFSSFSVGYYHLEEWIGTSGFAFKRDTDESGIHRREIATYTFPNDINLKIDDLTITLTNNLSFGQANLNELQMKQITFFDIKTQKPIIFEDFANRINFLLQNFLTFGLGQATRPIFITATNDNAKFDINEGTTRFRDIEIYFRANKLPDTSRILNPFEMTFALPDIYDIFPSCLNKWFTREPILRPIFDLYFATLNSSSIYLTHEFLNLVHGLESYHRRTIGGQNTTDSEFESLNKSLIEAIPDFISIDYKNSLLQRFQYLNELSLRRRLSDLIGNCSPMCLMFIKNKAEFIEQVVSTRNYFTHFDKKSEQYILKGERFFWTTQKLRTLLEICLMIEIGFSVELITALMKRNQHMIFLAQK